MPSQPTFGKEWLNFSPALCDNQYFNTDKLTITLFPCRYSSPSVVRQLYEYKIVIWSWFKKSFLLCCTVSTKLLFYDGQFLGVKNANCVWTQGKQREKIWVFIFNRLSVDVLSAGGGPSRKLHLYGCSKSNG